jgi:hypothetical protein
MKKRRKWIQLTSEYNKLPERISKERLDAIVPFFRRIDVPVSAKKDFEHEIIIGHLKLGVAIVLDFPFICSSLEVDDLIAEMELAVTKAVRMARRGALRDNNITGFIIAYIKHYIREELTRELYSTSKPRYVRYMRENNREYKIPKKIQILEDYTKNSEDTALYYVPTIEDDHSDIDVRDVLGRATNSKEETRLIELREYGYTVDEIVDVLQHSKSTINRMLAEIKAKFDKLMEEA